VECGFNNYVMAEGGNGGHENLEYKTLLACFDKLVIAFDQSPLTISNELVAKGLFPPQNGQIDGQRLAKLVTDKVLLKSSVITTLWTFSVNMNGCAILLTYFKSRMVSLQRTI
jgi:hypothetical protein